MNIQSYIYAKIVNMLVSHVDLLGIVERLKNNQLQKEDFKIINDLVFSIPENNNAKDNVVLVLGNPTCLEVRIPLGVELAKKNNAYLVVSGGVEMGNSGVTEAEGMAEYARKYLDEDKIIVENRSTITYENFSFSSELIDKLPLDKIELIIVTSSYHIQRARMNMEHYKDLYPKVVRFELAPSKCPTCLKDNWMKSIDGMTKIGVELTVIDDYIKNNNYKDFEI